MSSPSDCCKTLLGGAGGGRLAGGAKSVAPLNWLVLEHGDCVSKYREFNYQETPFDLFSRQYELARVDESREGTLIQVVDVTTSPEHTRGPQRGVVALVSTGIGLILALLFVVLRQSLRRATADPATARKLNGLRSAFGHKTPVA